MSVKHSLDISNKRAPFFALTFNNFNVAMVTIIIIITNIIIIIIIVIIVIIIIVAVINH